MSLKKREKWSLCISLLSTSLKGPFQGKKYEERGISFSFLEEHDSGDRGICLWMDAENNPVFCTHQVQCNPKMVVWRCNRHFRDDVYWLTASSHRRHRQLGKSTYHVYNDTSLPSVLLNHSAGMTWNFYIYVLALMGRTEKRQRKKERWSAENAASWIKVLISHSVGSTECLLELKAGCWVGGQKRGGNTWTVEF